MAFNEASIRDNLANDLEVLEPGLGLIETEHSLKNACGTSGRIDILAKDSFGNRVIIEVKRSDASARQALHELTSTTPCREDLLLICLATRRPINPTK